MDDRISEIQRIVERELSCSAHDLEHTNRVLNLALKISEGLEVDMGVLIPAVILHDIARAKCDREETKKIDHATLGSEMANEILKDLAYKQTQFEKICHCIESHRYRTVTKPKSIEARVLYDADKLESLGATGIARSYIMVGQYGNSIFGKFESKKHHLKEIIDKHPPNIEYELKYKHLENQLYTESAKRLANQRAKFMEQFFQQLELEVLCEL